MNLLTWSPRQVACPLLFLLMWIAGCDAGPEALWDAGKADRANARLDARQVDAGSLRPDRGGGQDHAVTPQKDGATPDSSGPLPDGARPDKSKPTSDMATPDKSKPAPDMATHDKPNPAPDMATPDMPQPTPDTATPDMPQPAPDTATPDMPQPIPDMATPDLLKPPADQGGGVSYSGTFPPGTGDLTATLNVAGYSRKVFVYRPAKAGPSAPLMLAFHGTHGTGWDMVKPYGSYARELADQQGVVVVAPNARKMTAGDWDDHYPNDVYWETYPSVSPSTNPDLLLVRALIQEAHRAYSVDLKRVYALGHSSGGFFSILTAMALPDRIAAFVSNSAGLVRCAKKGDCSFVGSGTSCAAMAAQAGYCACTGPEKPGPVATTGRKPPAYLVHSSDDKVVSVYYTCELDKRLGALGYTRSLSIVTGNGHSVPYNLAVNAWPFLSKHVLP